VDKKYFSQFIDEPEEEQKSAVRIAFDQLDSNKDGMVSVAEIEAAEQRAEETGEVLTIQRQDSGEKERKDKDKDDDDRDDDEEETTKGGKRDIPPEEDLKDKMTNEKDPDLVKYMLQLGIDPNYVAPENDPRRVVVSEFAIIFEDHDTPVSLTFDTEESITHAREHPLVIKEGCHYKMRVSFRVQHNVVLGLQIINQIYAKLGPRLAKDVEMLGTYPPKNDFQAVEIPKNGWHEAPKGGLARGEYKAKMKFVDDDNNCHLEFEYAIKISKTFQDE